MDSSSDIKQVIVVRKDLNMRKGKLAAQVSHASNRFIEEVLDLVFMHQHEPDEFNKKKEYSEEIIKSYISWCEDHLYKKVVVGCNSESELLELIGYAAKIGVVHFPIYDMGLTEFHGQKTLTCCSFGPSIKFNVDQITGHLKLI